MFKKIESYIGPIIGVLLFGIAIWVLHNELRNYRYHDIVSQIQGIPGSMLGLAILFTLCNYIILSFYEVLGFRYVGKNLAWKKVAFTSFIAYAFSNNVGFYSLSGSAVRFRLYTAWGLSTFDIAKLISFSSLLTFALGLFSISACIFIPDPITIPYLSKLHIPFLTLRSIGILFAAAVITYLIWSGIRKKPVKIKTWEFDIPPLWLSCCLIAVACIDWLLFGAVMYVLLPLHGTIPFMHFMAVFLLSQIIGLISHIPGGIGVFEGVMMLLMPDIDRSMLLGSLLIFRGTYYLLPFAIAALFMIIHELIQKKEQLAGLAQIANQWSRGIIPYVFAFLTLICGTMLIFSGVTPIIHNRLYWLIEFMPLPVLELSHFFGSAIGMSLLILAWGLYHRLDSAYHITLYLMIGGAIFSLLKGLDYEETLILTAMAGLLLPCRSSFYRKTSFINNRFSFGWLALTTVVLGTSLWLGFFSYKHIEYSHSLWWEFSFKGNASRFLRASVGSCVVVLIFSFIKLFSPPRPMRISTTGTDMDKVRSILQSSQRTYAYLSLLNDKSFLFSDNEDAFIMYQVQGRSWISMGDPVGPEKSIAPLIWKFRELVDKHNGWTVFYEIGTGYLPFYLDMGLTLLKMGEEARVDLTLFSLAGGARKGLRYTLHKVEQEGYTFEIIPKEEIASKISELKSISDQWLEEKKTREKRFSLGCFNEQYLLNFPFAIIRKGSEIVAFANIWKTEIKDELSVDLMRYNSAAPAGTMDFLFTNLLLWGQKQGYKWLNLGMAPFTGIETHQLSPMWNKFGSFISQYGENFYNFQGLRNYKDKFSPNWEPKYLAIPGGFSMPWILKDISSVVSGGFKGVFAK